MERRITPTLALVLAGGLAAGIALARPSGSSAGEGAVGQAATATAQPQNDAALAGGYGQPEAESGDQVEAPPATDPATDPATGPAALTIRDFDYSGATTAAPGQVINVTNEDGPAHTLTANDGEFSTGTLGSGESITFVAPTTPGTYRFFCTIHPSMQGELTIR